MFTSQLLSRVFPCGGKRETKHSNNSDRRHRFGTSLFHHFRKTASINDSSAVKNVVATTKNYDDDNDNDNNNRSNTNTNTNNNNNNKSKARTLSDERCDDGVSTSSFLSCKISTEMKTMMPLENNVNKNKKDWDDNTVGLSTPSPNPRQIITRQPTDADKQPHIISNSNVSQLLMRSTHDDNDDGGDSSLTSSSSSSTSSSSSSSSPASPESIYSLLSSNSSSSASASASASASSSKGILRLPARQLLGINEEINSSDNSDDLDLVEMYVIPLDEEEYNGSCRSQNSSPPVLEVIVPNIFDHYTALEQTKDNSSHHNSSDKRRSYLISGPPMRIGEWDHHTIESNPRELLLTNGCDSRITSPTTSSINNTKALFEPNIEYPTSTMTKNTTTLSDNYNRRRRNNKRRAALLQQVQQVQQQKQSLNSTNSMRWGDVHPRLLSTLNQSQHQRQRQHQRVVKWNMVQ